MSDFAIRTLIRAGSTAAMTVILLVAQFEVAVGQTMVSPAFKRDQPATAVIEPTKRIITIHSAGEPDPPLRYRFWPAPEHRRQGNPMPFFSRAILLSTQARQNPEAVSEFYDQYSALSETPIDKLPAEEAHDFIAKYAASALGELERAENLMGFEYDLQMDELTASESVAMLLPEFQESRSLARMLQVRARLAIAEGRWDDMVDDVRLGFRLAELVGRGSDLLIGRLVGYAISGLMMGVVEEAIERPGCPNLYWALASLPETKLDEIRDSIEYESALITRIFRDVGRLPDSPIGAAASREKLGSLIQEVNQTKGAMGNEVDAQAAAQLLAGFLVVTMAEPSRELLSATTTWGERAKELSAPEAVLRGLQLKIQRVRDNWSKWSLLPDDLWDKYKAQSDAELKNLSRVDVIESLIYQLTPAVDAARRASRRTRQSRNLLLTIEAIRMHAAVSGRLPKSIQDLSPVPAWADAVALKPFSYSCRSPESATLMRAPRWPGDPETTIELSLAK